MRHPNFAGLILLVVVCLAGCGGDDGKTKKDAGAAPPETWPVVMTFELDVAGAKRDGRVAPERSASEVMAEVLAIVRSRLRVADVGRHAVEVKVAGGFEVGLRSLAATRRDEIVALITRSGTLEFLIEVLPDEEYAKRRDPGDDPPARKGLWKVGAAAFAAFKRIEIQAWEDAQAARKTYKPTIPGYRLALESGKDGSDPAHFHVLEVPSEQETFDGRMVQDARITLDQNNQPVVVFDVKETWQNPFHDWTKKNLGMPLAIVLDGAHHSSPVIRAPLSATVQISLGAGPRSETEREAKALVTVLQTGSLVVAPKLVSIIEER